MTTVLLLPDELSEDMYYRLGSKLGAQSPEQCGRVDPFWDELKKDALPIPLADIKDLKFLGQLWDANLERAHLRDRWKGQNSHLNYLLQERQEIASQLSALGFSLQPDGKIVKL